MKGSSKRSLTLLLSVLLFIGAILVYSYLISPTYADIQQKQGSLEAKQKQFGEYQKIITQTQQLIAEYQNSQGDISSILPSDPEIAPAYFQLTQLASNDGLSIQSVDAKEMAIMPTKSSLVNGVGDIRFNVQVVGSYENLRKFFGDLESNIRIFSVNDLKIESVASDVLNISFDVDAYYQTQ